MSTSSKATGFLELNIDGFQQAISTAKKALVGLAGAFAVFKTGEFWKEGIEGAIKFGNEMYHAGQKLGAFDPGNLLIAQKALEDAGLGAEEARGQIDELVTSARPLSTLFQGAGDYAKALQNATASYGSQARVLSESAEKLSKVFEIIQSVGSKLQTFFLAMTAKFLVPLQAVLKYLDEIDLAGMGEAFGDAIAKAAAFLVGALKNGNIGEILGLSIKVGFINATNWLTQKLADIFEKLQEFKFNPKIFDALTFIFRGLGDLLAGAIRDALSSAIPGELGRIEHEAAESQRAAGNAQINLGVKRLAKEDGFAGGVGGFLKAFNTPVEEATEQLKSLGAAALKTGEDLLKDRAGYQGKIPLVQSALGHQDPYRVIASSLAKVGGGGGYAVQSMSIEARNQIKQIRAAEIQIEIQKQTLGAIREIKGPALMKN